MANVITGMTLKAYDPSLKNRGEYGEAKSVFVGGIKRAYYSAASIKRPIREKMGIGSIRTGHLEDYIEKILQGLVESGKLQENDMDAVGSTVCANLDCDWKKRSSAKAEEKEKKSQADKESGDEEKGRTMVVITQAEVEAAVMAAVKCDKKEKAEIDKAVKKALLPMRPGLDRIMMGNMTTSGILDGVDGVVEMGVSYSIDEMLEEIEFNTAVFDKGSGKESDPFYGELNEFEIEQKSRPGADAMANSYLHSNVMYAHSGINVTLLNHNLRTSTVKGAKPLDIPDWQVEEEMQMLVGDFMEKFAITVPNAKETSAATDPVPAIYYIESIKNGDRLYPDFNQVIESTSEKSICDRGIEKILAFAKDETFRTGDITRYVMLSAEYAEKYEKAFEAAGIHVLHNFRELRKMIDSEIIRLNN